jgi:ActR/RegA family two-component response regulator
MKERGKLVTFYSYKGGVGRTMALANVAYLLAANGQNVLAVDFDLEAPGLDKYFSGCEGCDIAVSDRGLLDMFLSAKQAACGAGGVAWHEYVSRVKFGPHEFDLLAAEGRSPNFAAELAKFRWDEFYRDHDGGQFVEFLRSEWRKAYDFVLIDSRTGVTDTGGICTVQLPDVLVLVFSPNSQSLAGAKWAAEAAQRGRALAIDIERAQLRILPVPSRFDDREEHALAKDWMAKFAVELAPFYENWLPRDYEPEQVLTRVKLPYVAHYSFGESLACAEDPEDVRNPGSLPYAYAGVAQLLAQDFTNCASVFVRRPFTAGTTDELQTNLVNAVVDRVVSSHDYDQYQNRGIMTVEHMKRMREMIDRKVQSGETQSLKDKRILWVHGNRSHDQFESAAFQVLGASVEFCLTTDEALDHVKRHPFDLIISNMRREDDEEAGLTLFDSLTARRSAVPFIIYTRMAVDEAFQVRARARDLWDFTNQPDLLFQMVLQTLNRGQRRANALRTATSSVS